MRAIDLAIKDLTQLSREWETFFFLLALPIIFTLMFGFAFGGFGGEEDPRLPLGVLDEDGSALSAALVDLLGESEVVRVATLKPADADRLDRKVQSGDLAAALVIPAGYARALFEGTPLRLTAVAGPETAGQTAVAEVQAVSVRAAGAATAARLAAQAVDEQAQLSPGTVRGFADEAERQDLLTQAAREAVAAWQNPPLTVEVRQSGTIATDESPIAQSGFSHISPSMLVQFGIGGLIGAAAMLVNERKSRTMRRMLTTSISRSQIIVGHYLAIVVLLLIQFTLLIVFGQLLLRVPYLRAPLATLLLLITTALWSGSLGLLIGTLARNPEQATLFSLLPMFILGGMGGAWVPLEFTGKTFQAIGHLLPTAWAIDGFENIVIRGLGLESVLLPAAIMLAWAVGLFALAAWRFRFE